MIHDDEGPRGAPDWMLTYGDLMSLLLTLFVMIVSMSEIKQNDRFQGIADSLHDQFGFRGSPAGGKPGELRPRNAALAVLAVAGRERRMAAMDAAALGPPANAAKPVATRFASNRTTTGKAIFFDGASGELSDAARGDLQQLAISLAGKPQLVEVRGVVVENASLGVSAEQDAWERGWCQARAIARALVETHGIEPERIRVAIATSDSSGTTGTGGAGEEKPRVEVFLLDEIVRNDAIPRSAAAATSPAIRPAARTGP
ncbi:MAG: flagellar motor protein MotB [Pirellulaceae bacterium]